MSEAATARDRRIADLEEQHAHFRAIITERGGLVPLDIREPLHRLEAELRGERTAAAAEAKGHTDEPKPGDTYFVMAMPRVGSKQHGRRGLRFEHNVRRKVLVVDASDTDVARRLQNGESIANPDGMLDILADPELIASTSESSGDVATERARADAAEARANAAEARLAELEAAARKGAGESNDGSPARLKAAAEARAKAEKPTKDDEKK